MTRLGTRKAIQVSSGHRDTADKPEAAPATRAAADRRPDEPGRARAAGIVLSRRQRTINLFLISLALLAFAMAFDTAVYRRLTISSGDALARLEDHDWYRLLRVAGTLWPWLITSLIFLLVDVRTLPIRRAGRRAAVLILSATLAGGAAELLKMVVGRLRPNQSDGIYEFVPFLSRLWKLDSSNLGMPSSHAAVAFGAAFALSFLYPRATWVLVPLAIGCSLTRVLAGAHYLSDVYVGLLVAFGVAWAVWRLDHRNNVPTIPRDPTVAPAPPPATP